MIAEARNDLIKSMTDNVNETLLNKAASSLDIQEKNTSKQSVEEHIEKTIKKDDKQFLEKKRSHHQKSHQKN